MIFMSLAMAGVLCGLVWKNLFKPHPYDGVQWPLYNDTAVVVVELDTFYHSELRVMSQPGIPLGNRVVQIYRFNSSCEDLPKVHSVAYWNKINVSDRQNYSYHYYLPTSTLSYTISSIVSVGQTDPNFNVKGYVYITRGPELNGFDSKSCTSSDCTIVYEKPFTYGSPKSFTIDESRGREYYNLHTDYIADQFNYSLELAVDATTVDLNRGNHVCNITDVNEGKGMCNLTLQFKIGKVCLVAYSLFEETPFYPYAVVNIEVTRQLTWVLVCTVAPLVLVMCVMFVSLIIISCCCFIRRHPPQYEFVNVF